MTITFRKAETPELKPRIVVFGVGGAGGNAVNNMLNAELQGVEFVAANTDAQALVASSAGRKIQLGSTITQGLGAGSKPEIGAQAAEASLDEIIDALDGCHMAFITAGMGGGTGTGAAPIIARAAKDMGILTVGVVTKPFHFEGPRRMRTAEDGIRNLQEVVDTLIIIPNQNLFRIANEKTTFAQAFAMADEVLHSGVRGITDLMVIPGLMNLDFADVRTVMSEMGKAMMGTGEADGAKRALDAAEAAIANPLLDDISMKGARGVLIHITGGMDLTLFEVDEAANRIRSEVDPDANIKVGSTFDPKLEGKMRVSVVATGIDAGMRVESPRTELGRQPLRAIAGQRAAAPAPAPAAPLRAAPVMAQESNPVHSIHAELEADLRARREALRAPPPSFEPPAPVQVSRLARADEGEPLTLGSHETPEVDIPARAPVVRRYDDAEIAAERMQALPPSQRRMPAQRPVAPPVPEVREKRGIMSSLFGSRQAPKKTEPVVAQRQALPQQRMAQPAPVPRVAAPEPRMTEPLYEPKAKHAPVKPIEAPSLFPQSQADDQLEIPAFLRRQAN